MAQSTELEQQLDAFGDQTLFGQLTDLINNAEREDYLIKLLPVKRKRSGKIAKGQSVEASQRQAPATRPSLS